MASDVQQTYYEWKHEQEDSQGPSISEMMDHGSISFGRFAFESLSWEKRSVFTHNERLEELENFKSPGLVAKKKAYFEEYYKKIRALKATQNQQIELSLDYGADESISSQTGDEDEPPLPSPNKMPESISEAPLEDLTVEIAFEHECNEAFEDEYAGPGLVEDATGNETIEPHISHCEVKKEEDYIKSVKAQISETEYLVHRLSRGSSEEIKLNENNHGVKWSYNKDSNLNMEPDLTLSLVCSTDPTVLNAVEADLVPVDNPVLEKNKLTVHKPKEDSTSVLMSKKHATSARHFLMSVNKSLPEKIKSTLGSKKLHTIIDKADIDITLSKKTSNKARRCDKSAFVSSYRSPTEVQNKVVISRASPLSKERKGAIPNDASKLVLRSHSEITNRSSLRKFNPKGKLKVQGESKETAPQNTIINRALQSKSAGHEEIKRNLGYCCSSVKGRTTTEHMKRSINLPCRNTHDRNRVISYQTGSLSVGDKSKKANASTTTKYEGKSSKITTVRPNGNSKVDTIKKQMTPVEKHERQIGVSKSLIGGLPLDVKKPRKENPRWR